MGVPVPTSEATNRTEGDWVIVQRRSSKNNSWHSHRMKLSTFATNLGIPTNNVIKSIAEVQVIESGEKTIQDFIDNELIDFTLTKGDIVILTDGRNTYSYIYNPVYGDNTTNADNYSLLSYFIGPDYRIEVVYNEADLYSAMSRISEVEAGEILFANDIVLTKDLITDLDNVTIRGNGNKLILYSDGGSNEYKIELKVTTTSYTSLFENVSFISYPTQPFSDFNFIKSRTVLNITNSTGITNALCKLYFKDCVWLNSVGRDAGLTEDTYNIIDNRTGGNDYLDISFNGDYFYTALSNTVTYNMMYYPFTIYRNADSGDITTVRARNSNFYMHSKNRNSNNIALLAGSDSGWDFDNIQVDETYTITKVFGDTSLSSNIVNIQGDTLYLNYVIDSSSTAQQYLPDGYYIESISVNSTNPVLGFSIGSTSDDHYYTKDVNLNDDYTVHFTSLGITSDNSNFKVNTLNNNNNSVTLNSGVPIYFSADDYYVSKAIISFKLKRWKKSIIESTGSESSSSKDVIVLEKEGITEDTIITNFFPANYTISSVFTQETAGATPTNIVITDEHGVSTNSPIVDTGVIASNINIHSTLNAASSPQGIVGTNTVTLDTLIYTPAWVATTDLHVYTNGGAWNGASLNLYFTLIRIK